MKPPKPKKEKPPKEYIVELVLDIIPLPRGSRP